MKRDLEADLELCEKATPGPWYAIPHPEYKHGSWRVDTRPDVPYANFGQLAYMSAENAQFVAAAREGWPYAIERVMAAEELLRKIYQRFNQCPCCGGVKPECWTDEYKIFRQAFKGHAPDCELAKLIKE